MAGGASYTRFASSCAGSVGFYQTISPAVCSNACLWSCAVLACHVLVRWQSANVLQIAPTSG